MDFPCEMVLPLTYLLQLLGKAKEEGRGPAARPARSGAERSRARSLRQRGGTCVTNSSRELEQSDAALEKHRREQSHLFDSSCFFSVKLKQYRTPRETANKGEAEGIGENQPSH